MMQNRGQHREGAGIGAFSSACLAAFHGKLLMRNRNAMAMHMTAAGVLGVLRLGSELM